MILQFWVRQKVFNHETCLNEESKFLLRRVNIDQYVSPLEFPQKGDFIEIMGNTYLVRRRLFRLDREKSFEISYATVIDPHSIIDYELLETKDDHFEPNDLTFIFDLPSVND